MKYIIYTLKNPVTNDIKYIGYTGTTLIKRLASHIKNVKEAENGSRKWNKRLSWIKSLSKNNLTPIIEELDSSNSIDLIYELEIYWIEQFKNWGFNLVNMTKGGDGGNTTLGKSKEELRIIGIKISKKIKGTKRSKESIEKFKNSIQESGHWLHRPGSVHPSIGKIVSEETRKKQSLAKKGIKLTEIQKINRYGKIPFNKNISKYPVIIQYSLNDVELREFKTAGEAIIHLQLSTYRQSGIIRCCKGITKTYSGYKWKFKINV